MRQDFFAKVSCRLCGTGERHTTGFDGEPESCTYWLDNCEDHVEIVGVVCGRSFWLPARYCPFCGKEL